MAGSSIALTHPPALSSRFLCAVLVSAETSPLQLMKKVVKGARPPIPPVAFPLHHDLQRLMQQCWQTEPLGRPGFEEVRSTAQ
jgi:hypothetical protein